MSKCYSVIFCMLFFTACGDRLIDAPPDDRPNILFIMADDHAYQAISAYGGDLIQTPNIDRLAQEGMLFKRAFVTNSICGPSRAAILTGQFSHSNGFYGNGDHFNADQMTFPKLLQQSGYQTAMIGKWHLYSAPQGFDYWRVLPGQGWYYNPDFVNMDGDTTQYMGYVTNLITDFALEWLRDARDTSRPFCLMYQHKAPHREWFPDVAHFYLFDDKTFEPPPTFYDDYSGREAAKAQEMTVAYHMNLTGDNKVPLPIAEGYATDFRLGQNQYLAETGRMTPAQQQAWKQEYDPWAVDFKNQFFYQYDINKDMAEWKLDRYLTDYLRCVASVDDNLGRVLNYLDENSLTENTIVVYTSDQGFYLGEHGWFDKRFMYEESFRTPLIIRYPKEIQAGSTSDHLVQNIDIAPTFLDYADLEIPEVMQGTSVRPLFASNPETPWRKAVYYHYYGYPDVHMVKRHYGVRTDRYKLIHFYYDIDSWEFFDLENDPQEMYNLIDDPAYRSTIDTVRNTLDSLTQAYGVPEDPIDNK